MSAPCPAWCAEDHTEGDAMIDQDGRRVRFHVGSCDAFSLPDRSEVRYDVRTIETTQHDGTVESTPPLVVLAVEVGQGGPAAEVELSREQTRRVALMLLEACDVLERVGGRQ